MSLSNTTSVLSNVISDTSPAFVQANADLLYPKLINSGTATLVNGVVTIATSKAATGMSVQLSYATKNATTIGTLYPSSISPGIQFQVTSQGSVADNSLISWEINV